MWMQWVCSREWRIALYNLSDHQSIKLYRDHYTDLHNFLCQTQSWLTKCFFQQLSIHFKATNHWKLLSFLISFFSFFFFHISFLFPEYGHMHNQFWWDWFSTSHGSVFSVFSSLQTWSAVQTVSAGLSSFWYQSGAADINGRLSVICLLTVQLLLMTVNMV